MIFPPGRPILVLLIFAIAGGAALLTLQPTRCPSDQVLWVFDPSHADTYQLPSGPQPALTTLYRTQTGRPVSIRMMASRALDARLLSLILSNTTGPQVPDLVEIEIGSVGKYFRASPEHSGLLPLDDFVRSDPATAQLLPARLATWTSGGHLLGIPRDVHPVSITYRKDLFDAANVDLPACKNWNQFQDACLRFQQYWQHHGTPRRAMQLARWNASDLMIMLYQQRINLIDSSGTLQLADPRVAKTLAFYATLVTGARSIAAPASANADLAIRDLADGHSAAMLTPDWQIASLRSAAPDLAGKLRMMPLPRFSPTDAPTASWGGTMVAIPRNCRDPQASWQLLHALQLSPEAAKARLAHSSILPAIQSAWADPAYDAPDPFFAGQPVGRLYTQLAAQLPAQYISPYSLLLSQTLSAVLSQAQRDLESNARDPLEPRIQDQLNAAQTKLARVLQFAQDKP